jgi:hypothetical protein
MNVMDSTGDFRPKHFFTAVFLSPYRTSPLNQRLTVLGREAIIGQVVN